MPLKSSPSPSKQLPKSEEERVLRLTKIEREVAKKGYCRLVGIDEAGRGPLAGPVVAAACLFGAELYFPGIDDSKKLSPRHRERLFLELTAHEKVEYGVGSATPEEIDALNILEATRLAMRRAVAALPSPPDFLLIDAVALKGKIPELPLIKGDSRSQLIAAASILAKESRDRLMRDYDALYPQYGFAAHKGYGTKRHLEALATFGPTPIHRKTFKWTYPSK